MNVRTLGLVLTIVALSGCATTDPIEGGPVNGAIASRPNLEDPSAGPQDAHRAEASTRVDEWRVEGERFAFLAWQSVTEATTVTGDATRRTTFERGVTQDAGVSMLVWSSNLSAPVAFTSSMAVFHEHVWVSTPVASFGCCSTASESIPLAVEGAAPSPTTTEGFATFRFNLQPGDKLFVAILGHNIPPTTLTINISEGAQALTEWSTTFSNETRFVPLPDPHDDETTYVSNVGTIATPDEHTWVSARGGGHLGVVTVLPIGDEGTWSVTGAPHESAQGTLSENDIVFFTGLERPAVGLTLDTKRAAGPNLAILSAELPEAPLRESIRTLTRDVALAD